MLPYDKHTMVELDRLAEQRQLAEERRRFAAATAQPRPLVARKLAGWVERFQLDGNAGGIGLSPV